MRLWSEHVLPRLVDRTCGLAGIRPLRARAVDGLHGRVLEIGFGSGLNVEHYPPRVSQVDAVEPSDVAWRLAGPRLVTTAQTVARTGLDGQRLDADDETYDCVLSTFTMCTIPDLDTALAEVHRVLRPGGALHFLEHGLSPDAGVARWQRLLQPVQGRVGGGCHLDRPIGEHLSRSSLRLDRLDTFYGFAPKPFGHLFLGRAAKS